MKKVAISGYFDPIHVGHLEYIELSKKFGDYLIVIINNNNQKRFKGRRGLDILNRMQRSNPLKVFLFTNTIIQKLLLLMQS